MNACQQALYLRLMQFEIDEPGVELTFAQRLARENGWTIAYAERVICEYKRFLFLAMHAGHVVTPSEQVDQAWHLHLTYTRSYWERLCRQVLGRPLHHGPTKGGAKEQQKYRELYQQTLASYRRCFGCQPPGDIWSDVDTRFGDDLHHRAVNTRRYWIIPKPRWPRLARSQAKWKAVPLMGVVGLGLPILLASNPLNWPGSQFLAFYAGLLIVALILAVIARRMFRPTRVEDASEKLPPLGYDELAYLKDGPAVASMVHAGTLEIEEQRHSLLGFSLGRKFKLKRGKAPPSNAPKIEHAIYDGMETPIAHVLKIRRLAARALKDLKSSLLERGLISGWSSLSLAQVAPAIIMVLPLLLAVPKIYLGIQREKPVAFLEMAAIGTAVVAFLFLLRIPFRTPAGDASLKQYQTWYQTWLAKQPTDMHTLRPDEMGMMIGLFGAGMLASGPLLPLHRVLSHYSGGGGCGGIGGSFDSGGDGGCGGNGGCGGGCGGCGGG
jgi:uncharacterized protein (TIGR04222 family)